MAMVKILLSVSPKLKWKLTQLDISNAFLNGDSEEEIYFKLPPGYSELKELKFFLQQCVVYTSQSMV